MPMASLSNRLLNPISKVSSGDTISEGCGTVVAVMLKYPNICFESNVLIFWDKISGKTNCTALGASESTKSAQNLQESFSFLVVSLPDPDIRGVNTEHRLSRLSTRISALELPRYLTCKGGKSLIRGHQVKGDSLCTRNYDCSLGTQAKKILSHL